MFKQIDGLKNKVNDLSPLNQELMNTIAQKFREEWTYNTNAIEGNTMTLKETMFFLREGLTVQGHTLQEHLEMKNHAEVINYLLEAIQLRDLTEGLIKEFHAVLFTGMAFIGGIPIEPGVYKTKDNHVLTVNGQIHYYTPPTQVQSEMEKLIIWYNNINIHPVEIAAQFHHKIVSIHPFADGNGRVSRLCMNFILMKNGYPPAIIRKENCQEYYIALEEADNGNSELFVQLVADEVKRSLEIITEELDKSRKHCKGR